MLPWTPSLRDMMWGSHELAGSSRYIHLSDIRGQKHLRGRRILDVSGLQTSLRAHLEQSISTIDPSVWQHDRIVLGVTLRVMRIGQVPSQLVQLGGADGADRGRRGLGVGGAARVFGVARRRLQRRETGGEGDVKERSCREGEELVVGSDEEGGEEVPSGLGVHSLQDLA